MEKQNAIFWKPPGLLKAHQARVSPEQLLGPRQCSNPFPVPAPPALPAVLQGSHCRGSYFTRDKLRQRGEVIPPLSK